MGGSWVIHATFAPLATGEMMSVIGTVVIAAAAYVWRRAGYQRHLHRIAEIERRIALRSSEQALA